MKLISRLPPLPKKLTPVQWIVVTIFSGLSLFGIIVNLSQLFFLRNNKPSADVLSRLSVSDQNWDSGVNMKTLDLLRETVFLLYDHTADVLIMLWGVFPLFWDLSHELVPKRLRTAPRFRIFTEMLRVGFFYMFYKMLVQVLFKGFDFVMGLFSLRLPNPFFLLRSFCHSALDEFLAKFYEAIFVVPLWHLLGRYTFLVTLLFVNVLMAFVNESSEVKKLTKMDSEFRFLNASEAGDMLLKVITKVGFPIERIMVKSDKPFTGDFIQLIMSSSRQSIIGGIFLKSHVIISQETLKDLSDDSLKTKALDNVAGLIYAAKQNAPLKLYLVEKGLFLLFNIIFVFLCFNKSWMKAFGIDEVENESESDEKQEKRWYEIFKKRLLAYPLCLLMLYSFEVLLGRVSVWFRNALYYYYYPQFDRMMSEVIGRQAYVDFLFEKYKEESVDYITSHWLYDAITRNTPSFLRRIAKF